MSPVSTSSSVDDMQYREVDVFLLSLQTLEVRKRRPDPQSGLADAPTSEGRPSAPSRLRSARVWFEEEERTSALSPRNMIIQFEDKETAGALPLGDESVSTSRLGHRVRLREERVVVAVAA